LATHKVVILPGDGIGPETVEAAIQVLDAVQDSVRGLKLEYVRGEAGANCIEKYGTNLPDHTVEQLRGSEACLKGAMTTPEEPGSPRSVAVTIRAIFDLYANVRPCRSLPGIEGLKPNVDMVIVRENTEDLYLGREFEVQPGVGVALRIITRRACERIAKFAFKLAMKRKKHVTYVHKGNILKLTDGIFKESVLSVAKEFPEVKVDDRHIDAMTMWLIKRPENFDVILSTNLFADILSDEAAQVVGGLGVAAGANIGDSYGMFEPVHGSAPKYAGKRKVNPIATILAAGMMLDFLGEGEAARRMEGAVLEVLREGKVRTYDLGGTSTTDDMGAAIAKKVRG